MSQNNFKGLKNEGTTCYLNSLIQTLFFIRAFRNAVYQIPTVERVSYEQDENSEILRSIPFCLQRIFYQLQSYSQAQNSSQVVRTLELLTAFGWNL